MPRAENHAVNKSVEARFERMKADAQTDRGDDLDIHGRLPLGNHVLEDPFDNREHGDGAECDDAVDHRAADRESDVQHAVTDYCVGYGDRHGRGKEVRPICERRHASRYMRAVADGRTDDGSRDADDKSYDNPANALTILCACV